MRSPCSTAARTAPCRTRSWRPSDSRWAVPTAARAASVRRTDRVPDRPDTQPVTGTLDAAVMAPEPTPTGDLVSRPRARREPVPLEQIPVWAGFDAVHPDVAAGDPPAGLDALLGGLNPEQLRAVTHGDGPLLVVAGAGTGKTQVITRRIAWLIATRRARPSEILALTFTDKAAAEMQVRVDQLAPD